MENFNTHTQNTNFFCFSGVYNLINMGPSGVMAALVVAVVVLGTCASGANAALRVQNNLNNTQLSVLFPPVCGSCPKGPDKHVACPEVCIRGVFDIESGAQAVTLEPITTYPPAYLRIQVQDEEYCVPENALNRLTATALLQVIGGGHNCFPNSLSAVIVDNSSLHVCLPSCSA